ncbi:hypothetical protein FRC10_012064 [Ceratobasidium sp. 414]|nr:hypothetical protein FRC10_012064 [Ceratobasidium sp. 414]
MESEPQLKPKPKHCRHHHRSKRKTTTRNESPGSGSQPSDQHHQCPAGEQDAHDTLSTQRHDAYNVLACLNKLLNGDAGPNHDEVDSLLHWATDLTQQGQPGQHASSSHTQHGSPSSCAQPGPSSSHAQTSPSSSCTRPGPPPPRAQPGPAPDCGRHRRARNTNLSGHNSEGEASTGGEETDVEATNADDPTVPERSGLSRYPGTQGRVALRAIRLLLSTAIRKGVYQSHDTLYKWARNAYHRTWKSFCPHISYKVGLAANHYYPNLEPLNRG